MDGIVDSESSLAVVARSAMVVSPPRVVLSTDFLIVVEVFRIGAVTVVTSFFIVVVGPLVVE